MNNVAEFYCGLKRVLEYFIKLVDSELNYIYATKRIDCEYKCYVVCKLPAVGKPQRCAKGVYCRRVELEVLLLCRSCSKKSSEIWSTSELRRKKEVRESHQCAHKRSAVMWILKCNFFDRCFFWRNINLINLLSHWNEDHIQEYPVTKNLAIRSDHKCELLRERHVEINDVLWLLLTEWGNGFNFKES